MLHITILLTARDIASNNIFNTYKLGSTELMLIRDKISE